ncbi:MAG: BPSS1780 family membrane protein [Dechloromonas sp.]|nr:BPSS1780 family membrane protein [Dechloromonas sp.]
MTDTSVFPMVPAPFDATARPVEPGACFDWLRQGWAMFLAHPGIWIGSTVLLLVMLMAISIVPFFGQVAAHLLVPLFGAGMLQICRNIGEGREPQIADLFAGFRHRGGQLVMVGVFFAAGMFGIAFLAFLLISGGVLGAAASGSGGVGLALGGIMLAGLLVMVLSVPVIMATWFAPALVYFHDLPALVAMKASFAAGLRNWLAMSIFGVFLFVAVFFAMLPLGLGLLLALPVFSAAVYASYRDMFTGV